MASCPGNPHESHVESRPVEQHLAVSFVPELCKAVVRLVRETERYIPHTHTIMSIYIYIYYIIIYIYIYYIIIYIYTI